MKIPFEQQSFVSLAVDIITKRSVAGGKFHKKVSDVQPFYGQFTSGSDESKIECDIFVVLRLTNENLDSETRIVSPQF